MPLYTRGGTNITAMANTWTAKQTFTPPANTEAIVVSGYSLTGANAQSLADWSGTWNTTGTPTAFKINITDTASNANSLLMDLQVGGSSKLSVRKDGMITPGPTSGTAIQLGTTAGTGAVINFGGAMAIGRSGGTGNATLRFLDVGNTQVAFEMGNGVKLRGDYFIAWSNSTSTAETTPDVLLRRDAANTLALRNGANAQTYNHYDVYTSSTDYHRLAIKTARATLSNVSGASVTATGLIPDGAIVVGVTTKVTTALGTSNGTTGYQVGDGSDSDRWGAITGTAAGTSSDNRDWTATTVQAFTSAQNVVITATGGNFDGTGVIYVSVQYLIGECD